MSELAIASLVVAGVGTGAAVYEGEKAAGLQKRQNALIEAKQKRDAQRQAYIAKASAENNAANQGVIGTSANLGGQASITSQLNSNLSFLDQSAHLTNQIGNAQSAASMFGDLANLSMNVFANSDRITKVFQPEKKLTYDSVKG